MRVPDDPENANPIVALAMKIRARRDLASAIDAAVPASPAPDAADVLRSLAALGEAIATGAKRLNSILGNNGVTFVRLERPLRLRLRRAEKRISLDADETRQLVIIKGLGLDGEYQFVADAQTPALINLSKLSTDAGYGDALTASSFLKAISEDAVLPRPAHLDEPGPMRF
ncbi:MAG TPA: hypothetical protein VGD50_04785 [Candidatus Baltobacteraceae bacterium]